MKQLFLKSNILHIRTNEGEFEVSNPESIGFFESGNFFLKSDEWGTGFLTDPIEWPGGVELIESCIKGSCAEANECIQPHYCVAKKLAQLISEESESAYKEFESSEPQDKPRRQEFEKYPVLTEHISRMYHTGYIGSLIEWSDFLQELNRVLREK